MRPAVEKSVLKFFVGAMLMAHNIDSRTRSSNGAGVGAQDLVDYFSATRDATIGTTAKHFEICYSIAYSILKRAIKSDELPRAVYDKRRWARGMPATTKVRRIAKLRKEYKSFREIGRELGMTGARAHQLANKALATRLLTKKQYDGKFAQTCKDFAERKLMFLREYVDKIEHINRELYRKMLSAYDLSAETASRCVHDAIVQCVKNDRLIESDGDDLHAYADHARKYKMSYSQLKEMADEFICTDITLGKLVAQYKLGGKVRINPSAIGAYYIARAVEYGIITPEQYNARIERTKRAPRKHNGDPLTKRPDETTDEIDELSRKPDSYAGVPYETDMP